MQAVAASEKEHHKAKTLRSFSGPPPPSKGKAYEKLKTIFTHPPPARASIRVTVQVHVLNKKPVW